MSPYRSNRKALAHFILTDGGGGSTSGEGTITTTIRAPLGTTKEKSRLRFSKAHFIQTWEKWASPLGSSGEGRVQITAPGASVRKAPIRTITDTSEKVVDAIELPVSEIIDGDYVIGVWLKAASGTVYFLLYHAYMLLA